MSEGYSCSPPTVGASPTISASCPSTRISDTHLNPGVVMKLALGRVILEEPATLTRDMKALLASP